MNPAALIRVAVLTGRIVLVPCHDCPQWHLATRWAALLWACGVGGEA